MLSLSTDSFNSDSFNSDSFNTESFNSDTTSLSSSNKRRGPSLNKLRFDSMVASWSCISKYCSTS